MQSAETAMTYDMQSTPKDVVPPGCQTGIYYIPISNLPFNASWQQLKDHVRQVCTVDHVEIFPKSTSGWVRVKGLDNFRAAFAKLNGKEFNGRALIADDRNGDRPVKIRDLMVPGHSQGAGSGGNHLVLGSSMADSTTSAPETPRYATDDPVSSPSSSMYASPTTTNMTSPGSYYSHSVMPGYDISAAYSQAVPLPNYSYTQAPSYYGFVPPSTTADQQYRHQSYAVQDYNNNDFYGAENTYGHHHHHQTSTTGGDFPIPAYASSGGGGVVYTEQRGIHIREISRRASDEQVRKMIRDAVGTDTELIADIEVPLDKDRSPRGWATAHFRSAELALRMVRELNQYEFKGRTLQVRLLKEGEAIGTSGGGGGHHSSSRQHGGGGKHHASSRKDGDGKKDRKDREKTGGGNTYVKGSSSSSRAPLSSGGGTSQSSSSSKDRAEKKYKDKEKEKHISKKSPVIVDGSTGRKHRS